MDHVGRVVALIAHALVVGSSAAQGNPLAPAPEERFVVTFDGADPAGVFDGILTIGADGPWTGSLTGSAYELRNQADVGAVRYHYLMEAPGVEGPLTQGDVTVDVAIRTEPQDDVSGARLIFDVQDGTGDYFAFVATAAGYALYRRDADGFRPLTSESIDAVGLGGVRRLMARTSGGQVELFVDDAFAFQRP